MPKFRLKKTKIEVFLRTQTTFFFTKYFVRTGNPRYLGGGRERILVFHKIDQIWEGKVAQF